MSSAQVEAAPLVVAMTATMLAPMAKCMSTLGMMVRAGMTAVPPPRPTMEPKTPAKTETRKWTTRNPSTSNRAVPSLLNTLIFPEGNPTVHPEARRPSKAATIRSWLSCIPSTPVLRMMQGTFQSLNIIPKNFACLALSSSSRYGLYQGS